MDKIQLLSVKLIRLIFLFLVSMLILNCNKLKDKPKKENKEVLLIATQNFKDFKEVKRTFKIFSDSSYVFTEFVKEENHSKIETFQGFVKINNDTLKFSPFELDFNNSETAVLKNGFMELIDGEYLDRMKINTTKLWVNNKIDVNQFKDYAVFTYYKKFNTQPWDKNLSNYDINNEELKFIDNALREEFKKKKNVKNFDTYLKQLSAVRNNKNEIIIRTKFYCNNDYLKESFQYYESQMHDGGNCNIYLEYNLSTKKILLFKIAGLA